MVTEIIRSPIFLSASIPCRERAAKYWTAATFPRITAAVRGLLVSALPRVPIVFGGHPAITPMVWRTVEGLGQEAQERVMLYQSDWYKERFVPEVYKFSKVHLTIKRETLESSLSELRREMLSPDRKERLAWIIGEAAYSAGVFIGGMEGIEDEYALFCQTYPGIPAYPIASTGGASSVVFEEIAVRLPDKVQRSLKEDVCYEVMFKDVLDLWET